MGSIPVYKPKLLFFSFIVQIIFTIFAVFAPFDYSWIFMIAGFVFYFAMYGRYRNLKARHRHETDTKTILKNLRKKDQLIRRLASLRNTSMHGANNTRVGYNNRKGTLLDTISEKTGVSEAVREVKKATNSNNQNK
jgi:biopolymer transport protein ExbB/TolQ